MSVSAVDFLFFGCGADEWDSERATTATATAADSAGDQGGRDGDQPLLYATAARVRHQARGHDQLRR